MTLLAPMVPMLFMGEEWGSKAPFPFFCDFAGDLADAVRAGRRREFAGAYAKYGDDVVPDPLDPKTFEFAKLDWDAPDSEWGKTRLALVRELLSIRRREIVPRLRGAMFGDARVSQDALLTASWRMGDGTTLGLLANLSPAAIARNAREATGTAIWGGEPGKLLPAWSVYWRIA